MSDTVNEFLQRVEKESQERLRAMERLVSAADASRVFGAPVLCGDHTVITAAQVAGGGGFGSGMGLGVPRMSRGGGSGGPVSTSELAAEGAGGGGGGGGGSKGRPVAAIVISPSAVEVKPILDLTKISLTALAALGLLATLSLRKFGRR
jgi:uncharacterized spore protein YtfJ